MGAPLVARALGKPGLEIWLVHLAPFAVFSSLLLIATGALEGRSRITHSIVLGEVAPNAIRIVLLPLVVLAGLPDIYIAHVLTLSVLLPWLFAAPRLFDRSVGGVKTWTQWDYGYSGKFVVATLFANQLAAVDILVMSVLFSSETVGDYAVASSIAAMFSFFQLAMLKRFAPRAGEILAKGDMAALRSEVEVCRRLTIGCGAFTIAGHPVRRALHDAAVRQFCRGARLADLACHPGLRVVVLCDLGPPPDHCRSCQRGADINGVIVCRVDDHAVRDRALARADRCPGRNDRVRDLVPADGRGPGAQAVRASIRWRCPTSR